MYKVLLITCVLLVKLISGVPLEDVEPEGLCYEHPNLLDSSDVIPVDCGDSSDENTNNLRQERPAMRLASFKCTESASTCDKAKATFQIAFDILGNVIEFKRSVNVKASYVNYCRDMGWCRSSLLGYAGPARSIRLRGTDEKRRMYPQGLVKQMNLTDSPRFSELDIQATFNSEARFWFQVDRKPIRRGEYDFLSTILHELIHGLGFTTQWNNYFGVGLTPRPNFSNLRNGRTKFVGFTENAFDQYLVEVPTMNMLTKIADRMSETLRSQRYKFASSRSGIFRKFQDSVESKLPKDLLRAGTKPRAIAFLPKNAKGPQDMIFLETSIRRFTQGSSLCHLDYQSNLNSPDFVMKYKNGPGSIQSKLNRIRLNEYSPIGPQLLGILETLGYTINPNPKPLSELLPRWGNGQRVSNEAQLESSPEQEQFLLW